MALLAISNFAFVVILMLVAGLAGAVGWLIGGRDERQDAREWDRQLEILRDAKENAERRLRRMERGRGEWDHEMRSLRKELTQLSAEKANVEKRARGLLQDIQTRDILVAEHQDEVTAARNERDAARKEAQEARGDLDDVMERMRGLEPLQADLAERDSRLAELEPVAEQLAIEEERYRRMVEGKDADIAERDAQIERLHERLAGQRAQPEPESEPEPEQSAAEKDNLQKIHGIGKVLEGHLNRLGYFTYRDVARWTQSDLERVAQTINTFPDRIHRDRWIDQARELAGDDEAPHAHA